MHPAFSRTRAALAARAPTVLVSLFAGVIAVVGSYAVAGFTTEFVGAPAAAVLNDAMPGWVVATTIDLLGELGSTLNVLAAATLTVVGFAAVAYAAVALGELLQDRLAESVDADVPSPGAPLAAAGVGAVAFAVTGVLLSALGAAVGAGLVVAAADLFPESGITGYSPERRRVLGGAGSAAVLGLGGFLTGSRSPLAGPDVDAGGVLVDAPAEGPTVDELQAEAASKSLDVAGLEPLISDDHYEVDLATADPRLPTDEWTLTVTGLVDEEVTYTYDDLRSLPAENRLVSLRCVGEDLNGQKLDTAVWTGVPMMEVLEPAGLPDECCVMLRAADDYYVQFPRQALEDGFLAYGMNGRTLPVGHGYPARALIPGRWGEVNVKWIEEIEVIPTPEDGYWEERGWEGTGHVNTVAKLHVENHLDDGRVEVAGHAYAGTRGVERVEISTDGGERWTDATLSEPLPGDDVWRQWVHRYDPPEGTHEVVVRAVDGNGEVQTRERDDSFPSGATGWVSREVDA